MYFIRGAGWARNSRGGPKLKTKVGQAFFVFFFEKLKLLFFFFLFFGAQGGPGSLRPSLGSVPNLEATNYEPTYQTHKHVL